MIKTFRGQLADDGQERIRLQTIKGKVGYRIVKFEVIGTAPGTQSHELVTQIWLEQQTTIPNPATIDFSNSSLIGVNYFALSTNLQGTNTIIFDNVIFNQDIYITNVDNLSGGSGAANYYIELEVIPLDDAGAEYTTLKDMRQ